MPTSYTSLLGLALPVQGELQGTWGDTVNQQITELLDSAVAGTTTISADADITLSTTTGAANQSRQSIILWTATGSVTRNITAPAQSKAYIVINDTGGTQSIVFRGVGPTTGVTIAAGERVLVAWDGSDFVRIGEVGNVVGPASSTDNAVARFDGTTGELLQNSSVIIADDGTTVISTNSATDALRITQTGAGNALVVEDSTNPDSSPFVVDASGNVGIGLTTVPDAFALYNSSAARLAVYGDGQTQIIATRFSTDANAPVVLIGKARGTYLSPTAVATGDTLGQMSFSAYGGSNYRTIATVGAFIDTYTSDTDISSNLRFSTSPSGSASATERMRIRSDGNIGIGGAGGALSRLTLGGTFTDASGNTQGIRVAGTVPSTTTAYVGLTNVLATQAAAFTLSQAVHFSADQVTLGAGSAVNSQIGFNASSTLTGATNNYGFYSDIASGTGRWNFYANGTAENYLAGNLKIGATTARGTTAGTNHVSLFNGTAPAGTLTDGVTLYSASGDFNFMDSVGNGFKVGYRNIPAVGTKTSSYILAVGDVGKYVQVSTGGSITIPDATFSEGDAISIFNNTSAGITITCSITTAYIAGTDADKATMTLATRGMATILFISGTVCVVSGNVS